MTSEMESLTGRMQTLERENALLRSMQSPTGADSGLLAENAMLSRELGFVRNAARDADGGSEHTPVPEALDEFRALPSHQRRKVARDMSPQQRDKILGRRPSRDDEHSYL